MPLPCLGARRDAPARDAQDDGPTPAHRRVRGRDADSYFSPAAEACSARILFVSSIL